LCPLSRRLAGQESPSGRFAVEKNLVVLLGIEPWFFCLPACSLVNKQFLCILGRILVFSLRPIVKNSYVVNIITWKMISSRKGFNSKFLENYQNILTEKYFCIHCHNTLAFNCIRVKTLPIVAGYVCLK
jgi:hypothetical protein